MALLTSLRGAATLPIVIAHRRALVTGLSTPWPYRLAIQLSADYIEPDLVSQSQAGLGPTPPAVHVPTPTPTAPSQSETKYGATTAHG